MIRKGRFALWESKEYEIVSFRKQYYLKSNNLHDLQWGFKAMNGNQQVLLKPVLLTDLQDAYEIIPYVMISSHRFAIKSYKAETDVIILVTNNPFVKNKIPVRPYGEFEYIIEVCIKDLIIEEDRVPILGFQSGYN